MIDLYTRVPVMGVRVLLGYGFSNPYPNPSKTRHFTPGFPLPAPIPMHTEYVPLSSQSMPDPRGHRDQKKRPGVVFFFPANFGGLTNLCNQAHAQI